MIPDDVVVMSGPGVEDVEVAQLLVERRQHPAPGEHPTTLIPRYNIFINAKEKIKAFLVVSPPSSPFCNAYKVDKTHTNKNFTSFNFTFRAKKVSVLEQNTYIAKIILTNFYIWKMKIPSPKTPNGPHRS